MTAAALSLFQDIPVLRGNLIRIAAVDFLTFGCAPGVVLLNLATEVASAGGLSYDRDGRLALGGRVSEALLERLLSLPSLGSPSGVDEVFLTGGGARNPAMVRAIEGELDPPPVRAGEELGMDPDAREAAASALLAWAHFNGIPANVPHATGSKGARVLGSRTPGRGDRPAF